MQNFDIKSLNNVNIITAITYIHAKAIIILSLPYTLTLHYENPSAV